MVKGVEGKTFKGWLKSLGLFNTEQRRPRRGLMVAYSSSWGEWRSCTDLCSLLTEIEPKSMAWSCNRWGSGWIWGEDSSPEDGQALEQALQGSDHCTKLAGIQGEPGQCSQSDFCVVLRGARVWTKLFSWVPSNLQYSMILWLFVLLENFLLFLSGSCMRQHGQSEDEQRGCTSQSLKVIQKVYLFTKR